MQRRIPNLSRVSVRLNEKPLGSGGEGSVYETSSPDFVAKIFHKEDPQRDAKLTTMLAHPPKDLGRNNGHISIAWPVKKLSGHKRTAGGYLMPKLKNSISLHDVCIPKIRLQTASEFNWRYLHVAALNLTNTLTTIHRNGHVVGDIKTTNILVDQRGRISIIDTDSFQIKDPRTRKVFHCAVGTEGFMPPELLRSGNLSQRHRSPSQDYFSLAVSIFYILFGAQPFSGIWRGRGEPPQINENVKNGNWIYGPQSPLAPGPANTSIKAAHPELQACFHRCFTEGHRNPTRRPSPRAWAYALNAAISDLTPCPKNPNHYYSKTYGRCYWCEQKRKLKIDVFSATPSSYQTKPQNLQDRVNKNWEVFSSAKTPSSSRQSPLPSSSLALPTFSNLKPLAQLKNFFSLKHFPKTFP